MKSELINKDVGERIDDLQCNNLLLIQNPKKFCFGIDAVLLADFVRVKNNGNVVDLCTGSGVIPLLLTAKIPAKKIIGVEIQSDMADMAKRSVQYNNLQEKVDIINIDIRITHTRVNFHLELLVVESNSLDTIKSSNSLSSLKSTISIGISTRSLELGSSSITVRVSLSVII